MKRSLATVVLTCLVTAMFAFGTLADELSFFSPIAGSNPGITLAGVPSAGTPWVVKHAFATLSDEGRLRASAACSDMIAATSAEIHARLQVPSPCLGSIILVRIAGVNGNALPAAGPWIAASGVSKDSDDN